MIKIFFIILALTCTIYNLLHYGLLLSSDSIVYCQPLGGQIWRLKTLSGRTVIVRQRVCAYRSFHLIILYFTVICSNKKVKVPIAFDATSTLDYIRLLTRLFIESSH